MACAGLVASRGIGFLLADLRLFHDGFIHIIGRSCENIIIFKRQLNLLRICRMDQRRPGGCYAKYSADGAKQKGSLSANTSNPALWVIARQPRQTRFKPQFRHAWLPVRYRDARSVW